VVLAGSRDHLPGGRAGPPRPGARQVRLLATGHKARTPSAVDPCRRVDLGEEVLEVVGRADEAGADHLVVARVPKTMDLAGCEPGRLAASGEMLLPDGRTFLVAIAPKTVQRTRLTALLPGARRSRPRGERLRRVRISAPVPAKGRPAALRRTVAWLPVPRCAGDALGADGYRTFPLRGRNAGPRAGGTGRSRSAAPWLFSAPFLGGRCRGTAGRSWGSTAWRSRVAVSRHDFRAVSQRTWTSGFGLAPSHTAPSPA
jgi:hypothetical protein